MRIVRWNVSSVVNKGSDEIARSEYEKNIGLESCRSDPGRSYIGLPIYAAFDFSARVA
jgi:hypothetical protein